MSVDLSKLAKKEVVRSVVYDKDWGVEFKVKYLSKVELQAMVGRNTKIEFDPKTHEKGEKVNPEGLAKEIADTCILGWKGVTFKWLNTLFPINMDEVKPEDEVPFTRDNLEYVLKNAFNIESWIFDTVKDAANFSEKKDLERKN